MTANRSGMTSCGRALAVLAVLCVPVIAYAQTPASPTVNPPEHVRLHNLPLIYFGFFPDA